MKEMQWVDYDEGELRSLVEGKMSRRFVVADWVSDAQNTLACIEQIEYFLTDVVAYYWTIHINFGWLNDYTLSGPEFESLQKAKDSVPEALSALMRLVERIDGPGRIRNIHIIREYVSDDFSGEVKFQKAVEKLEKSVDDLLRIVEPYSVRVALGEFRKATNAFYHRLEHECSCGEGEGK